MTRQLVITEKSSQAKDVRAAVGSRYGAVLAAEGHLLELCEPEDANPAWKRWSTALLKPEGLYATRPATGGNKAAKLKAIRTALKTAGRVWLATDCDREGQLIGQEILEHCRYRGEVLRVMFTAQDPETIRAAFRRARPNADHARLYDAAVARRQADQIYNLSLTRTATVTLGRGAREVIGIGRVKTPTLAIACRREIEIRDFVPVAYFEVAVTAHARGGAFRMRHAPKKRIVERAKAETVLEAARNFEGPLRVRVEDKRQRPPRLHDLPSLQKLASSRFGWPASKTLDVAQTLYDGEGRKILTYPRAEVRYLPESAIADTAKIVAGLRAGKSYASVAVPSPPVIRKGRNGAFHDKGLEGASHHAIVPNVNTIGELRAIWPRLTLDEKKLFDVVARSYLAAVMPDYRYRQTTVTLDVRGFEFRAAGRQPVEAGWRDAFPGWQPQEEKDAAAQALPVLTDCEPARLHEPAIEDKETRPPPRYREGTLIDAMQNAWRFIDDEALRDRLREAKGIGTLAARSHDRTPLPGAGTAAEGDRPPTAAMKKFAASLAKSKGIKPPRGYTRSAAVCRAFLDEHAGSRGRSRGAGTHRGGGDSRPVPGRNTADTTGHGTGSVTKPPGHATRGDRSTRSPGAVGMTDASLPGRTTGTPLRIPYGNKELAFRLGARYGPKGWHAPPGVDLAAFRERGWL